MIHSVIQTNITPPLHVLAVEGLKKAQILARLLSERFPGTGFDYEEGGVFERADCHPSIRDSALSFEVQNLLAKEIARSTDVVA